ncbi:MAG: thermonuclease family protein [Candidatus Kaistia colombiensis]|nr:MAG: thermonuclease family protein [Kaistia sp.]
MLLVVGLLLIGYVDQQMREIRAADGSIIAVRDGDSLAIDRTEFRIHGIDAPELRQTCLDSNGKPWRCGEAAKAALRKLVARGALRCAPQAHDRFHRVVATCRVDGDVDIGMAMLRDGYAVLFGGVTEGGYVAAEMAARRDKRGIWQGSFTSPSDWRQNHPRGD